MSDLNKILYLEDDPDIKTIAELSLVDISGFECEMVTNGVEALDKLKTYTPDIILSDMMMPEMDGVTFLKELKSNSKYKDIPVIFMTAKVANHEIEEYIKLGAIGVIIKPFNPMDLPEQIKELWAKYNE